MARSSHPPVTEPEAAAKRTEFYDTLGLVVDHPEPGRSVVTIPSASGFRNSRGELHGGIVASVADIAASSAARSCLAAGEGVATISLSLNFLEPAAAPAQGRGRVVSLGGRVAFVHVEVESDGTVAAEGIATVRLFRAKAEPGPA